MSHAEEIRLRILNDSERPVLMVGMLRSGKTLIEQILASRISAFKQTYPNARIIHTVRNPLDTCLS